MKVNEDGMSLRPLEQWTVGELARNGQVAMQVLNFMHLFTESADSYS